MISRLFGAWGRSVPWPFTVIGIGSLMALVSLGLNFAEVPGSVLLFLVSAVLILAGLAGLIVHVKAPQTEEPVATDDGPRTLNVYKKHDCSVTPALMEKFVQFETALVDGMKGQGIAADWDDYAKLAAAAEANGKPNTLHALRARCESLLFLTEAFHRARHKGEDFRPNW